MALPRFPEEESETGGHMEELISALELAIARVDELLAKEECGFIHNRLERVKFNLLEAILLLLKEEK